MKARVFKMVLVVLAVSAAAGVVLMLLWNTLLASIFGLGSIDFCQALGLFVFARILFGNGFGCRMAMGGFRRPGSEYGKNPIREKWEKMTPEEREEFINKRREFGRREFFGRRESGPEGPFGRRDFFGAGNFDCGSSDETKKENGQKK